MNRVSFALSAAISAALLTTTAAAQSVQTSTLDGVSAFCAGVVNPDFTVTGCPAVSGQSAQATGWQALAIGPSSAAVGMSSFAAGATASAGGDSATAVGAGSSAGGYGALAVGVAANASDFGSTAAGYLSSAASGATAVGAQAAANGQGSAAFGENAQASGQDAFAGGGWSLASGASSFAGGYQSQATGAYAVATGAGAVAGSQRAIAIGQNSAASGDVDAIAIGGAANATGLGAIAIGGGAAAVANSVAIGWMSSTTEVNTVSFGNSTAGTWARLVNVGGGMAPNDAVNVRQVADFAAALGGGAAFNTGTTVGGLGISLTAPSYAFTAPGAAGNYTDVGSALSALDAGLNAVNQRIDSIPAGPQGPAGATGATGPQGPAGANGKDGAAASGGGTDALAVHYDDSTQTSVTLSAAGTQLHNVETGSAPRDAANVAQVSAAHDDAVRQSSDYIDEQVQAVKSWTAGYVVEQVADGVQQANAYTDWRLKQYDLRLSRLGAMQTAQAQMTASFAGADPTHANRIAVGTGFSGGVSGVAVGYQHTNGAVAWNVGGSIAGGERSVGGGVGVSW